MFLNLFSESETYSALEISDQDYKGYFYKEPIIHFLLFISIKISLSKHPTQLCN